MHSDSHRNETRILIVGDHALVRQGLVRLVDAECDLTVCAEAENAVEALEAIERHRVDLAIVDISLAGVNGIELTETMKSRYPDMLVLVLSVHDGLFYARRALQAGASGYVAKHEASEKMITAIHQVLGGEVYISCSEAAGA
jgi:DNA-binding NarL/FixJ family response regulator